MEHSFCVETAKKHGIEKAILLKNLEFWIRKNMANNKHCYDGMYWTYNSYAAFAELFPYIKEKRMGNLLREMEAEGLIKSGNYNKSTYDRTKWYTIPSLDFNKDLASSSTKIIHNPKLENGLTDSRQPIPDSKPDDKHIKQQHVHEAAKSPSAAASDDYVFSVIEKIISLRSQKTPITNKEGFKRTLIQNYKKDPLELNKWTDELFLSNKIQSKKQEIDTQTKLQLEAHNKIKEERMASIEYAREIVQTLDESIIQKAKDQAYTQALQVFKKPPQRLIDEMFAKIIIKDSSMC